MVSDAVPEFIDPCAAREPLSPRPLRRFTWLLALPLLPFAPRRVGIRLSVTGWPTAVAAHLLCILIAFVVVESIDASFHEIRPSPIDMFSFGTQTSEPPVVADSHPIVGERIRTFVTSAVNRMYVRTKGRGDIYAVLAIPFAVHALCWFWAFVAMPYVSVGERFGLLRSRTVKLVLFSSTTQSKLKRSGGVGR